MASDIFDSGVKDDALYEKMVEDVLGNFDFERVHKVMTCLDWKWREGIPNYYQLIKTAKDLLERVLKKDIKYIGTGGFTATKEVFDDGDIRLGLYFSVADWESESWEISKKEN